MFVFCANLGRKDVQSVLTLRGVHMRKLVALVVLAGAVVAWTTAAQAKGPNPPGLPKILGSVPARPHAAAAVSGYGQLSYHGGPVMLTNKTYAIFWIPSGYSVSSLYVSLINRFL